MTPKILLNDLNSQEIELVNALNVEIKLRLLSLGFAPTENDIPSSSKTSLSDMQIVDTYAHSPESPSSVEDFYERPFYERMSLFPKRNYHY
jgi:hypothetical protein